MFNRIAPLAACSAFLLCATATAGSLVGTVRMPPGIDGKASPAIVYVQGKDADNHAAGERITVDQLDRQFVPRVQAMPLGGSIVFRNSDPEAHNVNLQSSCCGFNEVVGPASVSGATELAPVTPTRVGLVRILCNIHQEMRGYVMVCPSRLFTVTDGRGPFRIEGVPAGKHKIVVWQEFARPLSREIEVADGTRIDLDLERAGAAPVVASSAGTRAAPDWGAVLQSIAGTLDAAVAAADRAGGSAEAERLASDAYFKHFEASGLETAVRLYGGEERVFVLEEGFRQIRALVRNGGQAGDARGAVARLMRAIEGEVQSLRARGITDATRLAGGTQSLARAASVDFTGVLTELRRSFDGVRDLARHGKSDAAAASLADAYLNVFHRIEPALAARDFARMRHIEDHFLAMRGVLQDGASGEAASAELDALGAEIERAALDCQRAHASPLAAAVHGFSNAFLILTREGVEALLIVTAILLYLARMGQADGKRAVGIGLLLALAATVVTWLAFQWLIGHAALAQEAIEGVVALVASGVLFYVSYWLISRSQARRWHEFLTRQVGRAVAGGNRRTLALAAFLAVYREGAETILMLQPVISHPARGELIGVFAGMVAAALALAAIFWGLRCATFRLPIRPFFRVTGALLFVLAVVFAGKGVTELQEAGFLAYTPLPAPLGSMVLALPAALRDALGLGTTVQSLAIQGTLVAGAIVSLLAVWLVAQLSPVAEPVAAGTTAPHGRVPAGSPQ